MVPDKTEFLYHELRIGILLLLPDKSLYDQTDHYDLVFLYDISMFPIVRHDYQKWAPFESQPDYITPPT